MELFSGTGRLCRLAKSVGLGIAAHDISYDKSQNPRSAMDINESGGFLLLVYTCLKFDWQFDFESVGMFWVLGGGVQG